MRFRGGDQQSVVKDNTFTFFVTLPLSQYCFLYLNETQAIVLWTICQIFQRSRRNRSSRSSTNSLDITSRCTVYKLYHTDDILYYPTSTIKSYTVTPLSSPMQSRHYQVFYQSPWQCLVTPIATGHRFDHLSFII